MTGNTRTRYRAVSAASSVTQAAILPRVTPGQRKSRSTVIKDLQNLARLNQVPAVARVALRAIVRKT